MRRLFSLLLALLLAGCPGAPGDPTDGGGGDGGGGMQDGGETGDGGTSADGGSDGGTTTGHDCDDPHPSWLFCEDFEDGAGDFDAWFAGSDFLTGVGSGDRGRIDLSDDDPRSGSWAVHMPAAASSNYQGADLVWYACDGAQEVNCDLRGYDRLYFRTWIRFAPDHEYVHHFLNIGGIDRFWNYGSAGCLPNGESTMGSTVDFDEGTHETFFYTYHLDMGCDANCGNYLDVDARCQECEDKGFPTCTDQKQCCWGNHDRPATPKPLPVGEWFCFEMAMEANTPSASDGWQAYWIGGELAHRAEGYRWRTTDTLQLNRVRLQHYIAGGDADQSNRVWFDDVVVSTEPIGCD